MFNDKRDIKSQKISVKSLEIKGYKSQYYPLNMKPIKMADSDFYGKLYIDGEYEGFVNTDSYPFGSANIFTNLDTMFKTVGNYAKTVAGCYKKMTVYVYADTEDDSDILIGKVTIDIVEAVAA